MVNPTFHSRDPDLCQWIVDGFKDLEIYKDNGSVQEWIKFSEDILSEESPNEG